MCGPHKESFLQSQDVPDFLAYAVRKTYVSFDWVEKNMQELDRQHLSALNCFYSTMLELNSDNVTNSESLIKIFQITL